MRRDGATTTTSRGRILGPLLVNVASVCVAGLGIFWLNETDGTRLSYFRLGPHDDLTVLAVPIDTWARWWALALFLSLMGLADVLTEELANPVLTFTIYNPDKRIIAGFGRFELQVLANLTYLTSALKRLLLVLVQISQCDLALVHIAVTELATVFTIRTLLAEKTFVRRSSREDDDVVGHSKSAV